MPIKVSVWYRRDRRRWCGIYRINGVRYTKTFEDKAHAVRWRGFMNHQLNHEGWIGVKALSWFDLCSLYLEHKAAQDIAEGTESSIENTLKQFEQAVGPLNSDAITQRHVEQFVLHRRETVKANTVNRDLKILGALYRWACKFNYMHSGLEFTMLKTLKKVWRVPRQEQLVDLFREAKTTPSLHCRMVLAVATGLRRSAIERIGLSEQDDDYIDIENNELVTTETKGRQQVVKPLGPNVVAVVMAYVAELPTGTEKMFEDKWDSQPRITWERIRKKAGLPKLTFHQLRNLSVSILADKGESAAILQKHTGHSSFKTTQGYIGVSAETQKRVTATLDGILGKLL